MSAGGHEHHERTPDHGNKSCDLNDLLAHESLDDESEFPPMPVHFGMGECLAESSPPPLVVNASALLLRRPPFLMSTTSFSSVSASSSSSDEGELNTSMGKRKRLTVEIPRVEDAPFHWTLHANVYEPHDDEEESMVSHSTITADTVVLQQQQQQQQAAVRERLDRISTEMQLMLAKHDELLALEKEALLLEREMDARDRVGPLFDILKENMEVRKRISTELHLAQRKLNDLFRGA